MLMLFGGPKGKEAEWLLMTLGLNQKLVLTDLTPLGHALNSDQQQLLRVSHAVLFPDHLPAENLGDARWGCPSKCPTDVLESRSPTLNCPFP